MAFDYLANEALRCGRVFTLISSLEHYETHITPSSSIWSVEDSWSEVEPLKRSERGCSEARRRSGTPETKWKRALPAREKEECNPHQRHPSPRRGEAR